jgi:hypothetical protein
VIELLLAPCNLCHAPFVVPSALPHKVQDLFPLTVVFCTLGIMSGTRVVGHHESPLDSQSPISSTAALNRHPTPTILHQCTFGCIPCQQFNLPWSSSSFFLKMVVTQLCPLSWLLYLTLKQATKSWRTLHHHQHRAAS